MILPIYANPAEAPDWMREQQGCRQVGERECYPRGFARMRPVYRVKASSRPHPWPPSKQQPAQDFIIKRFIEQQ